MSRIEPLEEGGPMADPPRGRSYVLSGLLALGAGAYLCLLWVQRSPWMPAWLRRAQKSFQDSAMRALVAALEAVGVPPLHERWRWAIIGVVLGVILPWLGMALFGRGRPYDLGLRWPNRVGWRVMTLGYLVALPLLWVMAALPATRAYYRSELTKIPLSTLAGTYLVLLVTEHFMFHGLFLALLRPGRRWPVVPEPAPVEGRAWHRALRWLGLAQPAHGNTRLQRAMRWIGVPEGCLGAMILQAVLFGVGHVGKAPAELLLSFPGGLGLAYAAYRCNSFLVPMILHLATGLTALGFIFLF